MCVCIVVFFFTRFCFCFLSFFSFFSFFALGTFIGDVVAVVFLRTPFNSLSISLSLSHYISLVFALLMCVAVVVVGHVEGFSSLRCSLFLTFFSLACSGSVRYLYNYYYYCELVSCYLLQTSLTRFFTFPIILLFIVHFFFPRGEVIKGELNEPIRKAKEKKKAKRR